MKTPGEIGHEIAWQTPEWRTEFIYHNGDFDIAKTKLQAIITEAIEDRDRLWEAKIWDLQNPTVYFSPATKLALADILYKEGRISKDAYLEFIVNGIPDK